MDLVVWLDFDYNISIIVKPIKIDRCIYYLFVRCLVSVDIVFTKCMSTSVYL